MRRISLLLLLLVGIALFSLGTLLAWWAIVSDSQWIGMLSLVTLALGCLPFSKPFIPVRKFLAN